MTNKKRKITGAVAGLIIALLYLVLPTDLVPDIVPAVGWIDDIVAILIALGNVLRVVIQMKK